MGYVDIIYEKEDGVAWITVNRPQVYNAMRARTNQELADALLNAGSDNSIRVVVISGAGPNAFGSGQDQSFDNPDPRDAVGHTIQDSSLGGQLGNMGQLVRSIPQPVIAMVNGFCIGASNILAYNCDLTIASDRAIFGQAGARVGSPAAGHGTAYLASLVGQKKAREIWYMTRQYSAQEALQMGLVNAVVPAEKLKEEVKRWCEEIKRNSPIIIQMEKIGFNEYGDLIHAEQSPFQRYLKGDYSASGESVERRQAFIERRPVDQSKNLPYAKVPREM
jgi:dihydroxynaphthoic acid synthetase